VRFYYPLFAQSCVSWPVVGPLILRKSSVVCVELRACVRACVRVQVLLLYLFIQKGWEIFICFSYYSLCYSKSKYSILCKQFWGQLVLNSSLYLVWLNLILALFMTDLFILLFSDSNLNLVFQYLCLLSHDSLVYPSWDFHNILGLDLRVWGHVIQFLTQCKD
jgi:hypothetical protein